MTVQNIDNETPQPAKPRKIWRLVRWFIYFVVILIVSLLIGLFVLASSDRGSKWLLDFVMEKQKIVKYQYKSGNLIQGLNVHNILVKVKDVEVQVDQAEVHLGWRAILDKEIHLMHADVGVVKVINHAPPSGEDFKFSPIRLPFVLRLDDVKLDELLIQTQTAKVIFKDIRAYDALWSGTKIELNNASMDMGYLNAKKITGFIQLDGKYPLKVKGDLTIPALAVLNIHEIKVDARGTLDTLQTGVATVTPDILSGYVIGHPVRTDVPMQGKLAWENFNWPLLSAQALHSDAGTLNLSGDLKKLNFDVLTDLSGKNIPQGQYQALLSTDLKQLNLASFKGQLMQGDVDLNGVLSWQKGVTWDIKGNMRGIYPQDPIIPEVVQQFLPEDMSGTLASKGSLNPDTDIVASVDFSKYERWDLHLKQATSTNAKKPAQPLVMNVAWQGIDRQFPYVGWLKSTNGDVDLVLSDRGQDIKVMTAVDQNEKSMLPAGQYAASLNLVKNRLNIKDFSLLQGNNSRLLGQAVLTLPTEKTALQWTAQLNAQQFNPQNIIAAAPVNRLDGQIKANGYAKANQQIIHLNAIDLTGKMIQGTTAQNVNLTGKSTVVVSLHDGKKQSGLKGFAVEYDGHLNAANYSKGPLTVRISGTPSLLNINKLYHEGAAGKIDVKGRLNLGQQLVWNLNAHFNNFKPDYFVSQVKGNITGQLNTQGEWSERSKSIAIQNLNLFGQINNKRLFGQGNLAVQLTGNNGIKLQPQQNNNIILSYANNIVQAIGDGQQGLKLNVKADRLADIYPGLHGSIKGAIAVQTAPELTVKSNLIAQNVGYGNVFNIAEAGLKGTLPTSKVTPSQLSFYIKNAASGKNEIGQATINMTGLQRAHVVDVQAHNKIASFALKLAGGMNPQGDWLGQLQEGWLKSVKNPNQMHFKQMSNANIVFRQQQKRVMMTAHCWKSQSNSTPAEFCFTRPVLASPEQIDVALGLKSVQLESFKEFLPNGFGLKGQLGGYANVAWRTGQTMQVDTQLLSRDGAVDLISEDNTPINFKYKSVRLMAKTLAEGLSLNLTADSSLGNGFADVLIGHGENKSLKGLVSVNGMRLDLFKPFVSDLRILTGDLSLAGRLHGQLQQPKFEGEIRLKQGAFALASVPVDLQNIELSAAIKDNVASIKGGFNAGSGVANLTGSADFNQKPIIKLNLDGAHLQVMQPPLIRATVSPKIDVTILPLSKVLTVKGFVGVPSATISMPEAGPAVVNVSPDVRVVDKSKEHIYVAAAKAWNIDANINVHLNKSREDEADNSQENVVFRGFNSVIPLAGRVNLSQKGTEIALRANGTVGVRRQVMIEAYGQRLDLNRAIARFNGELANPTLDIEASKNIQNSTVGLRITGGASQPNIQIYNDAGLSEQEATNALLTGRISSGSSSVNNTEGFKSDVNNTLAAAGISMGLGGTRAFTNQLGRTFGLSGLALDAEGSGDDTQVSVTGYITPDLYLRYGVGIFTPVNKLTLRYQVNRRLYVEATSSLERAVDIFYNWRF